MTEGAVQRNQVLAISGGVGGAKLALGLARVLSPEHLSIVANTGDDFEHLGLSICPDLDTVMYTLAGLADNTQGWGLEGETWRVLDGLKALGGPDWFRLGDRDLATHLYRSNRLAEGTSLSEVTAELCQRLGVAPRLLPMSDAPVKTLVGTADGELNFQEYFVRDQCRPAVTGFRFAMESDAALQPQLRELLASGTLAAIVICPSNPFVSVAPLLALPGARDALRAAKAPIVAVSPIIGGTAVKGPAAKMMAELGLDVSALGVARHYRGLIDGMVIDSADAGQAESIAELGMAVTVAPTLMRTEADKRTLAARTLAFADTLAGTSADIPADTPADSSASAPRPESD